MDVELFTKSDKVIKAVKLLLTRVQVVVNESVQEVTSDLVLVRAEQGVRFSNSGRSSGDRLPKGNLILSGVPGCGDRTTVMARVNPDNNLPTSQAHREKDLPQAAECLNSTITAVNDANVNLTKPEKELLRWHYRLGHIGFKRIQFLMRTALLTHSSNKKHLHQAAYKIEHPPKCAACQYGAQH